MFLIVKKDTLVVHGTFETENEALKYINYDTTNFGLVCLGEYVIDSVCTINNKRIENKKSVLSGLKEEQMFYVTLIAGFMNELVNERIITPSQRSDITFYMFNNISNKNK